MPEVHDVGRPYAERGVRFLKAYTFGSWRTEIKQQATISYFIVSGDPQCYL